MRSIAYAQVVLPSGKIVKRAIVDFDAEGIPLRVRPLREEEAFVEWHNKVYYFLPEKA